MSSKNVLAVIFSPAPFGRSHRFTTWYMAAIQHPSSNPTCTAAGDWEKCLREPHRWHWLQLLCPWYLWSGWAAADGEAISLLLAQKLKPTVGWNVCTSYPTHLANWPKIRKVDSLYIAAFYQTLSGMRCKFTSLAMPQCIWLFDLIGFRLLRDAICMMVAQLEPWKWIKGS